MNLEQADLKFKFINHLNQFVYLMLFFFIFLKNKFLLLIYLLLLVSALCRFD